VSLEQVLDEAEILVLGAPHHAYRGLDVGGRDVVDVWGAMGEGIRL
jgi:UDP-N-acetyl-D-mannosaminuronic acid dehydrogenase